MCGFVCVHCTNELHQQKNDKISFSQEKFLKSEKNLLVVLSKPFTLFITFLTSNLLSTTLPPPHKGRTQDPQMFDQFFSHFEFLFCSNWNHCIAHSIALCSQSTPLAPFFLLPLSILVHMQEATGSTEVSWSLDCFNNAFTVCEFTVCELVCTSEISAWTVSVFHTNCHDTPFQLTCWKCQLSWLQRKDIETAARVRFCPNIDSLDGKCWSHDSWESLSSDSVLLGTLGVPFITIHNGKQWQTQGQWDLQWHQKWDTNNGSFNVVGNNHDVATTTLWAKGWLRFFWKNCDATLRALQNMWKSTQHLSGESAMSKTLAKVMMCAEQEVLKWWHIEWKWQQTHKTNDECFNFDNATKTTQTVVALSNEHECKFFSIKKVVKSFCLWCHVGRNRWSNEKTLKDNCCKTHGLSSSPLELTIQKF